MEGNLTKGPILKTLTKLAIPIMASSFLGTLYNITDMAWIGLLGSKAVAGVGVGGMFTWLSQGLASMARMGGQVQVAQCIGHGDREKAHGFAQAAVQLAAAMGMAYAILSLVFTKQMVSFFQLTDAEAYAAAMSYTRIACGLIVFSFMTLTLTGLYTAQGDSKTPFLANLIGLVTNMILDPVLILGPGPFPKLGVIGAAIATVMAQAIVMSITVLAIIVRKKENVLKGIKLLAKIPEEYLSGICRIGIPTAIQGMAYCAISMVLTRMVSGYGAEAVATQRVGGQIESISWNTADGFAAALNAFIAQNYGAGNKKRVLRSYFISLFYSFTIGLILGLLLFIFGHQFLSLFATDAAVIDAGMQRIKIMAFSYCFSSFMDCTIAASRGIGKTIIPTIIIIMGSCVFRIVWIYTVFAWIHTIPALFLLYLFSWIITSIAEITYFIIIYRKL